MKIKKVEIESFKRFTNLTIDDIPESAKLVVMVGPNGSGKTSVFDAFNCWINLLRTGNFQKDYYLKAGFEFDGHFQYFHKKVNIDFHGNQIQPQGQSNIEKKAFYFRTAHRNQPDFTSQSITKIGDPLDDSQRPQFMMSAEARVADNYQRLAGETYAGVYRSENAAITVGALKEKLIGKVRDSMARVFDGLLLEGPGDPISDGTFFFQKGTSSGWRYKNLSGGEKAAFDLLLDFIIKTPHFDDTVYCIDEPEIHMHTRLQGKLLKEMLNQLPDGCQLWIATHSIGMMRCALDLHKTKPDEVVFLDFGDKDFDAKQKITPVVVNRAFWKNVFNVALDDLAGLVAPAQIVFCEGASLGTQPISKNTEFDAKVYRTIFAVTHPDTEFISLGGSSEVEKNAVIISNVIGQAFSNIKTYSLLDRDDRSDSDMAELRSKGKHVLNRRNIESYLWSDEIIRKFCLQYSPAQAELLIQKKNQLLADSLARKNPADDIKKIVSPLYDEFKKELSLTQSGSTPESFALQNLAPLITSELALFDELRRSVFQEV